MRPPSLPVLAFPRCSAPLAARLVPAAQSIHGERSQTAGGLTRVHVTIAAHPSAARLQTGPPASEAIAAMDEAGLASLLAKLGDFDGGAVAPVDSAEKIPDATGPESLRSEVLRVLASAAGESALMTDPLDWVLVSAVASRLLDFAQALGVRAIKDRRDAEAYAEVGEADFEKMWADLFYRYCASRLAPDAAADRKALRVYVLSDGMGIRSPYMIILRQAGARQAAVGATVAARDASNAKSSSIALCGIVTVRTDIGQLAESQSSLMPNRFSPLAASTARVRPEGLARRVVPHSAARAPGVRGPPVKLQQGSARRSPQGSGGANAAAACARRCFRSSFLAVSSTKY